MVPIGGATTVKDIRTPFMVQRGWRKIRFSVEEAEWLQRWLAETLKRPDVRRPIKVKL